MPSIHNTLYQRIIPLRWPSLTLQRKQRALEGNIFNFLFSHWRKLINSTYFIPSFYFKKQKVLLVPSIPCDLFLVLEGPSCIICYFCTLLLLCSIQTFWTLSFGPFSLSWHHTLFHLYSLTWLTSAAHLLFAPQCGHGHILLSQNVFKLYYLFWCV